MIIGRYKIILNFPPQPLYMAIFLFFASLVPFYWGLIFYRNRSKGVTLVLKKITTLPHFRILSGEWTREALNEKLGDYWNYSYISQKKVKYYYIFFWLSSLLIILSIFIILQDLG